MAFPATPLPIKHELLIDGAWVNITSKTRGGDRIEITRGYSSEQASLSSGTCRYALNNRDAYFSSRMPTSTNYGKLGRSIQMRTSITADANYLRMLNATVIGETTYDGARAWTADKAVLDITGDLDVRFDGEADFWYGAMGNLLAAKYVSSGDQRSWAFFTDGYGYLYFTWTTAGTAATRRTAVSTVALTSPRTGRLALRATIDVDNGAAGTTVTFYTSDTITGSWTILGAAVTSAGTTSIHAGTSQLEVGTHNTGAGWSSNLTIANGFNADVDPFVGKVYGMELRTGIAGTLVADFDATSRTPGDTSWSDGLGTPNTWTLDASAEISDANFRFWGEQAALSTRWDTSGTDVFVLAQAGDIFARLTNGQKILKSAIFRNLSQEDLDGYWPGEDDTGATTLGAVSGNSGLLRDVDFGPATDFPGTAGHMTASSDTAYAAGTANFAGSNTGTVYLLWYFDLTAVPAGNVIPYRFALTGGNCYRVDVQVGVAAFTLTIYDSNSTVLHTSAISFGSGADPNQWLSMRLLFTQNGANVDYEWGWYPIGGAVLYGTSGSFAGTIGRPRGFQWLAHTSKTGSKLAHVVLDRQDAGFGGTAFVGATNAHAGETVVTRFRRLCAEERIPGWFVGLTLTGSDATPRSLTMGPQTSQTFVDLIKECSDVDGGILYAPRDRLGVALLPLTGIINRDPLELDYAANVFSGALEPTPDDFQIRNDVTAVRSGGSSARWVRDYGPLNTSDPQDDPNGVGTFDVQINRNVGDDLKLLEQAQWDSALGTWDEDRYTRIQLELHRSPFTASTSLTASVRALDAGKPFTIANPPSWLPPDDVLLYVRGYTEILQNQTQTIILNAAPYGPYRTGVYGGTTQRADSNSSTTAEALDTTETGIDISTTALGDVWTTAAGSFPFFAVVGGETVTDEKSDSNL